MRPFTNPLCPEADRYPLSDRENPDDPLVYGTIGPDYFWRVAVQSTGFPMKSTVPFIESAEIVPVYF